MMDGADETPGEEIKKRGFHFYPASFPYCAAMSWSDRFREAKEVDAATFADQPKQFDELRKHLSSYVDQCSCSSDDEVVLEKELILETRCALRFATKCLAAEETRSTVQEEAVLHHALHEPLCHILSSQENGDAKSRLLAARLLSNLVTNNAATAERVMAHVLLSPSADEVSAQIQRAVAQQLDTTSAKNNSVNWVDMMLGCARSGNRDALAGVVAALHNCVVVEEDITYEVATNQILISTLLRQMLPAAVDASEESRADAATEWISLFLELLGRRSFFPQVYNTVGGSVTPEHLVLLHCISSSVDEWLKSSPSSDHPLGMEEDALVASHAFLAEEASRIRATMESNASSDDKLLIKSALITMYEIVATSLGDDSNETLALVRLQLGKSLLPHVAKELATVVDVLHESHKNTKARDLKLQEEEQHWIVSLVRVLGNLCFRCKPNQDALRQLQLPLGDRERTALHVLLSCTSLASGCFTLREWAIVALRNALEGNLENQALVEKLEAQQPLQTAELERMGVQVEMDRRGQVKVVPKEP